jgi:hypothetical protein
MQKSIAFFFQNENPKYRFIPYFIFAVLGILIYFQSFQYGYALDDIIVASENKFVKKGFDGITEIFCKESFTGYFGEQKNLVAGSRYRPLSIATFAVEYEFFKSNPKLSHVINVLLYILCLFILFNTCKKLLRDHQYKILISALTTLLFLAHPVHVEAVANIKGRDEILCFLFSFLSLNYFIDYYDTKKVKHVITSSFFLFLGLLSKENALPFVLVAPMCLYFFRGANILQLIKPSFVLLIAGITFIVIRVLVIGFLFDVKLEITDLMNDPFLEMNTVERFCTILFTLAWYIKLLFVPYPLTHDYYPYHVPIIDLGNPLFYLAFLGIFGLLFLAFIKLKKRYVVSFLILFFFITILLVSNIFFPVGTFMNERFLFIPSFASCFFLSYFGVQLPRLQKANLGVWMMLVMVAIFTWISYQRVPAWTNGDQLNFEGIKVSKNSARLNMYVGVTYFNFYKAEQNQDKKYNYLTLSEKYLRKAIQIYPEYGQGLNMLSGVAAEWHKKDGDISKLLSSFEFVIGKQHDLAFVTEYLNYLAKDGANSTALYSFYKKVGWEILFPLKKHEVALQYLGLAYKMNENDKDLLTKIGKVYLEFANVKNVIPAKRQEYLNNGNAFLNKAQSIQ